MVNTIQAYASYYRVSQKTKTQTQTKKQRNKQTNKQKTQIPLQWGKNGDD